MKNVVDKGSNKWSIMVSNTKQPKIMNNISQKTRNKLFKQSIMMYNENEKLNPTNKKLMNQLKDKLQIWEEVGNQLYQNIEVNLKINQFKYIFVLNL